jgi:secreted trypsin-like serine protease
MPHAIRFAAALAVLGLTLAPCAQALVGGTVDANTSTSPWAGVVSITPTTNGAVYSGALLDRYHVLTAAHVAASFARDPSKLKINVNAGGDLTQQLVASHVFVHPDYSTGNLPNDNTFAWNDDIAVIRLAEPVAANVPVYSLFNGTPGLGGVTTAFTMVAYGGFSDGVSTTLQQGSNTAVKRVGQNRVTGLFGADDEGGGAPPNVAEGFVFIFNEPGTPGSIADEAGYAGGDSGSPIFTNDNGVWRIAGVGAFNGNPSNVPGGAIQYGAIGGGMLIAPYAQWIQAQMTSPVPEPDTYALLLAGLGLVTLAARRLRSKTA